MINLKDCFLVLTPIFIIFGFFSFRYFNFGSEKHNNPDYAGTIRNKWWALNIAKISLVCFVISFAAYIFLPDSGKIELSKIWDILYKIVMFLAGVITLVNFIFKRRN